MANAICIRCGARKRSPFSKCIRCDFDPNGDLLSEVKSIILSVRRYDDGSNRKSYERELDRIGQMIAKGEQFEFNDDEVQRLLAIGKLLERPFTWGELARLGLICLGFLLPLIILIVLIVMRYH